MTADLREGLEACPFCGGEAKIDGEDFMGYFVECAACGGCFCGKSPENRDPALLAAAWNRRSPALLAQARDGEALAADLRQWDELVAAFIASTLPPSFVTGAQPLWPNPNWTQEQAMLAFALHRAAHPDAALSQPGAGAE